MIKKIMGKVFKVKVTKPGTKQVIFTLRIVTFDPKKHFVGTDEAKEFWRKEDRISKAKIKNEFCSIFAASTVVGRGKTKHLEFNKTTKDAANTIFIVPTKYRQKAYKEIQNLELF